MQGPCLYATQLYIYCPLKVGTCKTQCQHRQHEICVALSSYAGFITLAGCTEQYKLKHKALLQELKQRKKKMLHGFV